MDKLTWYESMLNRDNLTPQYRNFLEKRQLEARLDLLATPETRQAEPFVDLAIPRVAGRIMRGEVLIETVEANLHMLATKPTKE